MLTAMPRPGMAWRHVIINTRNTWLHGEERGFRDRKHRVHSSGDYRHRPPKGEHAGLYCYFSGRAGAEVHIPLEARPLVGKVLVEHFRGEGYRVVCMAVTKVHAHGLVEMPDNIRAVKAIVGEGKRKS